MKYNVVTNGKVVKKNLSKKQAEDYCEKMNKEFMDSQEKVQKQKVKSGLPLRKSKYELYKVEVVKENVIRLTESDLVRIIERVINEGNIDKSTKTKDFDVKMDNFQDSVKKFLKGKDCKVKQVGDDFEVHSGDTMIQVMFRKTGINIKKEGDKFGKEFDFNEMGKIKSYLNKML
ncbi:hypothetical protein UFOVP117_270 [uncultured Caudovirales phage]|uniref:Uncharacterized protein n=1 Tax=uncultured Caudovirales phage TaxID=2100421 RepID=A0A6J5LB51_9CAUD|nr:hypothetical protein UFOVP117_270 [uncultured Caudovirales phage]